MMTATMRFWVTFPPASTRRIVPCEFGLTAAGVVVCSRKFCDTAYQSGSPLESVSSGRSSVFHGSRPTSRLGKEGSEGVHDPRAVPNSVLVVARDCAGQGRTPGSS
jgi:hypothetical protein